MRVARESGLPTRMLDEVALVATELAANLHRHARGGELLVLPPRTGSGGRVAVVALDRGPGVEHFETCLGDGYSTTGTLGTGLGAVQRLATDFDAVSEPGRGTVVSAGFRPARMGADGDDGPTERGSAHFDIGAVGFPIDGEDANGDAYACVRRGSRLVVLLADGLGHGVQAARASGIAVAELPALADRAPDDLLAAMNLRMMRSRGAAVSVATLELDAARRGGTVLSSGLGNVSLVVAGADGSSHRIPTQHGTAGARANTPTAARVTDFPPRGTLILHSDGLTSRWTLEGRAPLLRHSAEIVACALWRDHLRGSDDTMVVVVRAASTGRAAS